MLINAAEQSIYPRKASSVRQVVRGEKKGAEWRAGAGCAF